MANARRDDNRVTTIIGTSSADGKTPVNIYADPVTHRLYVDASSSIANFYTDTFTSTSNQTVFTTTNTPTNVIYLAINGAIQTPSSDYTSSGKTFTLTNGIPPSNIVLISYTY